MSTKSGIVPGGDELLREALIVLGGALIAALVLSQLPQLRDWINRSTRGPCDCDNKGGLA